MSAMGWRPNTRAEAERAAWDADGWDESAEYHLGMILGIVNVENRTVLDFGCGPGRIMRPLARLEVATEVIGYDPNMRMLAWGTEAFRVFTRPCDVPRVDVVYSTLVFQHLTPIEKRCALADISRMLLDHGTFVVQYVDAARSPDVGPLHNPIATTAFVNEMKLFGLDAVELVTDPEYPTWSWIGAVKQ